MRVLFCCHPFLHICRRRIRCCCCRFKPQSQALCCCSRHFFLALHGHRVHFLCFIAPQRFLQFCIGFMITSACHPDVSNFQPPPSTPLLLPPLANLHTHSLHFFARVVGGAAATAAVRVSVWHRGNVNSGIMNIVGGGRQRRRFQNNKRLSKQRKRCACCERVAALELWHLHRSLHMLNRTVMACSRASPMTFISSRCCHVPSQVCHHREHTFACHYLQVFYAYSTCCKMRAICIGDSA